MANALDIRAQVTCSLGELISGSISDSQPANSGLIFTKGSIRIVGSTPPVTGTLVTFKYDKYVLNENASVPTKVTRNIERGLYVIGSSVNPTKNYTDVELGCRLTMLRNYAENKQYTAADGLVDGSTGLDVADGDIATLPLSATKIASAICAKLGISSNLDLDNKFSVASFDVSQGYVSVLNDLLYAESRVGYMKTSVLLEVADANPLTSSSLTSVIDETNLIEINPLSIGEIPLLKLIGQYNFRTLQKPETDAQKLNWEQQESYGLLTTITIDNPVESTVGGTAVWDVPDSFKYTYTPYTLIETTYDTFDRVVTRKTTERSIVAEVAPSYIQHIAGKYVVSDSFAGTLTYTQRTPPEGSIPVDTITTESYVYKVQAPPVFEGVAYPDGYEDIERQETVVEEPVLRLTGSTPIYSYAGQVSVEFTYGSDPTQRFVARRDIRTFETSKGVLGQQLSKTLTEQYLCHAYTQEGQQILADALQKIGQRNPFDTAAAAALFNNAQIVKRLGTSVEINSGREVALQQRPPQGERTAQGVENKQGTEVQLTGVGIGEQTVSMPYACDDIFVKQGGNYTVKSNDILRGIKARLFLKTYFYYMLGLRNGFNVTTVPEALPPVPMTGVTVNINGKGAGFMPTAITYTMDANGIVASADLLLAGGAQGDMSQAWFTVASGISYTAPALTPTDTRPTVYLGQIATVGANAQTTLNAAYPTSVSGDGVQAVDTLKFWVYNGSVWVDRGTNPAVTYPAYTPVPTTLFTQELNAASRTGVAVQSLPYAIALQTALNLVTKTRVAVQKVVVITAPLTTVSVAANAPDVAIGAAVQVPSTSVALAGLAPAVSVSTVVAVPLTSMALAAFAPTQAGADDTVISVPLTSIAIAPQVPEGVGADLESFYNSWRLQVYGTDAWVYPDWWAD